MSFLKRLFGDSKRAEAGKESVPQAPSIVDVFNTTEFFRLEKEGVPVGGAEFGFKYIVHGNKRIFVASAQEHFTEKLYEAAIRGNVNEVQKLLNHGANINASLRQSGTVLHGAATFGKTEVITLLLAKGADVNAMDYHGNTPLERAVHYISEYSNRETVELLRRHGGILICNAQMPAENVPEFMRQRAELLCRSVLRVEPDEEVVG